MADQPLESLISRNHRRVISVPMRLLEEYSIQLLELFEPFESEFISRESLSHKMAEKVEREITALRSMLRSMKDDLGLEHYKRSAPREAPP
ncbi:MAG TPA: hypothetical protein VFZ27_11475 [Terriglobia bacterium]|nr:hypothetical protein [Terriglobia bacterium]